MKLRSLVVLVIILIIGLVNTNPAQSKSVLQLIPFQNTVSLTLPNTSKLFAKVTNKQIAPIIDGTVWPTSNTFNVKCLSNKVVFVSITRTWCPACRDEWEDLNELYQSYKSNKSFQIVALVIDDGILTDPMEEFLKAHPVDFTVVIARNSKKIKYPNQFADLWDVSDFPANYLVDKSGWVKYYNVAGGNTRKHLDQLLGIKGR